MHGSEKAMQTEPSVFMLIMMFYSLVGGTIEWDMASLAACLLACLCGCQGNNGDGRQGKRTLGKYRGFNEDGEVGMKEFLWRFSPKYNFHALREIDIEPNPSHLVMDLIDELKQAPAKLVVGTEGV